MADLKEMSSVSTVILSCDVDWAGEAAGVVMVRALRRSDVQLECELGSGLGDCDWRVTGAEIKK